MTLKSFWMLGGVVVVALLMVLAISRFRISAADQPDTKADKLEIKRDSGPPNQTEPPKAQLGVIGKPGFLVTRIMPGTTAEQIGLKPGDTILRIDGREVSSGQDISGLIHRQPGEQVKIVFTRYNAASGQFASFEAIAALGQWKGIQ